MQPSHNCKNLEVWRGTSKGYELRFYSASGPKNITGWTVYFTVKAKMEDIDNNAVIKKDVTTHYAPLDGKTVIELTPTDTNIRGSYFYDIKVKDDVNNIFVVAHGRIVFKETVTVRG